MTLEKSFDENDKIIKMDGFDIVISSSYDDLYQHLKIDWVENYSGKGFQIFETLQPGCR